MHGYTFTVSSGTREIYREEILATSKADAIDMAESAILALRKLRTWTTAILVDEAGVAVWEGARPIDTRDETAPPN